MPILLILSLVFFYLAYHFRANRLALMLLVFYGIGSLAGYVMTQHSLFPCTGNSGHQDISIYATVYIFIGCMILFYPILSEKNQYKIEGAINFTNYKRIAYIFIIISFLYCIYVLPYISLALNAIDFVAYKNDVLESGGLDVSGGNVFLEKLFSFQIILRPFITFLFCYSLAKVKGNKTFKVVLGIMALLPAILHSLAAAHRNISVFALLDFLICFMLFYDDYSEKVRRIFYTIALVVGSSVIVIVVVFAIFRFADVDSGYVEYSLYRYMGEPFVNFNTMLWGTDKLLDGNKSFPIIRQYLGMSYIDPSIIREELSNLPYYIYYFYSIIGNFYMDFGPVVAILMLVVIACFFNYLFKTKFKLNTLTRYLLLFLYTSSTIKNYFYFEFMGNNNVRFVWNIIFVLIVCHYIDRSLTKKI